jgi:threonine/homoserine/homoserine lactone efflux protein
MEHLHATLLAILTGFVSGFILSVPVGPVNLTIVNEGARRGLLWAALIGFGAVAMEAIYCALAFTGFAVLFEGHVIKGIMEVASFLFFLYLGIRFLRVHRISEISVPKHQFVKLNPHSAFAIGFVRVMGNPGVFLFWIVLATRFRARGLVESSLMGSFSCVGGVIAGTGSWFSGLAYMVSRGHGKFTEKTLLRMEHISGICLLIMAAGEGLHILWQLARHEL